MADAAVRHDAHAFVYGVLRGHRDHRTGHDFPDLELPVGAPPRGGSGSLSANSAVYCWEVPKRKPCPMHWAFGLKQGHWGLGAGHDRTGEPDPDIQPKRDSS
jgi:hypothetical protein